MKPNLLFLMTDQHRWDALGCVNPRVKTPNMDALARRGIRFSQAICNAPMCVPSRYSLMHGVYPFQCGVRHNTQMITTDHELPAPALPERLAALGYQTVGVGKTHWYLGKEIPCGDVKVTPSRRGFEIRAEARDADTSATTDDTILMAEDDPQAWADYRKEMEECRCGPESITGFIGHSSRVRGEDHREGWLTRQAVKFLRETRDRSRPFFLNLSLDNPHAGFNVPPGYEELYRLEDIELPERPPWTTSPSGHVAEDQRASEWRRLPEEVRRRSILRYYALCTYVDDCFGRVLAELETQGELANTLVLFTSDHGEMLGEHGERFTKYCFYESSIRVPLVVAGAGVPAHVRGTEDRRPAELVDVLPTFLEAAGGTPAFELAGRSLLSAPCRLGGFAEMHGTGYETVGGPPGPDWRTKASFQAGPSWMWRTERWKLILHLPGDAADATVRLDEGIGELYDLAADPNEWRNLYEAEECLRVRERLTRELLLHVACVSGRFPMRPARPKLG